MLNYLLAILKASASVRKDVIDYYSSKLFGRTKAKAFYTKRIVKYVSSKKGGDVKEESGVYSFVIPYRNQALYLHIRGEETSDFGILKEFFSKDEYKLLFDLMETGSKRDLSIVDAGGNIGLFTSFCKCIWPQSRIIYLEPDTASSSIAKLTFGRNHFEHIQPLSAALWKNNKYLSIVNDIENYEGNASFRVEETDDVQNIPGVTLKDLLDQLPQGIDILKVDIEGSEKQVFSPETFTLDLASKINVIVVEIHDHLVNKQEVIDAILNQGFKIVSVSAAVYLFSSLEKASK